MRVDKRMRQKYHANCRTRLVKGHKIEKNIKNLAKLNAMFDEVFYTELLKIPKEYVKGFQIFALDSPKIIQSLKAKNKGLTAFILKDLSAIYLKVINEAN